jgi:multiple RNA-binding domain-containing protein 1
MTSEQTSRILVKNLPKYITQERLKKHFSSKGENVTDVKLVKTKDGKSRRFAYVGFKTNEEGLEAVRFHNNTFMDTCKLQIEVAKTIGDDSIPRPWSKYSTGSSAFQQQHQIEDDEEKRPDLTNEQKDFLKELGAEEEDPQLKEFLEVMRPRQAASHHTWANDDVIAANANFQQTVVPIIPKAEDEDLYEDLPKNETIVQAAENSNAAFNPELSDLDYLKSKMGAIDEEEVIVEHETMKINPARLAMLEQSGVVDSDKINNALEILTDDVQQDVVVPEVPVFDESPSPDTIADTGRIMVRNLAYTCTYEDLEDYFKRYGPIAEIHMPIDKVTKECKGYAFVLYVVPEHAVAAFMDMHNAIFQGRILEIVAAKEKPKAVEDLHIPASFKAKREQQKKTTASNDFNWNSLFMNSDAVAEAIARKLGVQKNQILDAETDDMAVRLALAETTIINETKEYLLEEGVSLDAFGKRKDRSNTIILVKNIPSSTTEDELMEMFGKFGTIGRLVLPPARTIALVEIPDRNEAKIAFRKLAYKKFKTIPLYLEWAPAETFTEEYNKEKVEQRRKEKLETPNNDKNVKRIEEGEKDQNAPAATIFVKNLNFETTEKGLKEAFEGIGGLRSVRISTKPNPKQPGSRLSMGFGFLEFTSTEDAMRCVKGMQVFLFLIRNLHWTDMNYNLSFPMSLQEK